MVCALCVLVVAVLVYWRLYLLGPSGDPFTRGPFVIRLSTTEATLAWSIEDGRRVELTATGPGGTVTGARRPADRARARDAVHLDGVRRRASAGRRARSEQRRSTCSEPVRFAVIGDYGSGNDHEWAVGRTLAAERPDFVTTAGDNSYLVAAPQVLDRNIFDPLHDADAGRAALGDRGRARPDLLRRGRGHVGAPPPRAARHGTRSGTGRCSSCCSGSRRARPRSSSRAGCSPSRGRSCASSSSTGRCSPGTRSCRSSAGGVAAILAGHLHRYERRTVGGVPSSRSGRAARGRARRSSPRPRRAPRISLLDYGSLLVEVSSGGIATRSSTSAGACSTGGQNVRWPRIALGALGSWRRPPPWRCSRRRCSRSPGSRGIVAFVLAAGCLAADAIPYRPAHFAAAALALVDAVVLAVGGRAIGIPVIVPAALLLLLQVAPAATTQWLRRGPRPGFGS